MPESLLVKVRMSSRVVLHDRRKVHRVLEGEHGSIHKGRSVDIDDLREYVSGDDVKDIDWKATARSGRPLIKRFVATRQHAVLLVVDTGRTMAGLADATSTKRDVAVTAAGVFAQAATGHGDLVGLVAGPAPSSTAARNAAGALCLPLGKRDVHVERILRAIHDATDPAGQPSRLDELLEYVTRTMRRRMILAIIADDTDLTDRRRQLLRRLIAQHEVLYCTVGDATMTDPALRDEELYVIGAGGGVPAFFRDQHRLDADLRAIRQARAAATLAELNRLGIVSARLDGHAGVVAAVVDLLERQRRRSP